jgi:hypothetical protein
MEDGFMIYDNKSADNTFEPRKQVVNKLADLGLP